MNREPPTTDPLLRFLGVAAFLTVPVGLSLLAADGATHDVAHLLTGYSPERLAHGAVWTLPLAALVVPNVRMIGPTTLFTIAFLLPYALFRGPLRALVVFFSGHLVAMVAVAIVAIGGHIVRWSTIAPLYRHLDLGASAGLAAVVGALAGVVLARSWPAGVIVVVAAAGSVLLVPVLSPSLFHEADAAQHLVAFGVGLLIERHWGRSAVPAGSFRGIGTGPGT